MVDLQGLETLGSDEAEQRLSRFIAENEKRMTFANITTAAKKKIWRSLLETVVSAAAAEPVGSKALAACRILSRDGTDIDDCIETADVDLLMALSGINDAAAAAAGNEVGSTTFDAVARQFEGKKVLSNLIHKSSVVRAHSTRNGFVKNILGVIQNHKSRAETERFDLRLLFLLTALCPEQTNVVKNQLSGLTVLNRVLSECTKAACLDNELAQYTSELLRLLFNLTCRLQPEDTEELVQLGATLNSLLRLSWEDEEAGCIVLSNTINLLTNFEGLKEATSLLLPEGDLANIEAMLQFLLTKLDQVAGSNSLSLKEEASPALSVLWILSKAHPEVRRYLKRTILPPLTANDIQHKPESGKSARGRLVALLTNPDVEIATMTAELLFVLCKHNVGKLVKHSGYGNAAGLLARRGLMAGRQQDDQFSSSEEEDSDTEEYQEAAHKINPITGCVEEERKNPLEGMSEEQKEYEAMKLVNMMDQLMKAGFIKPAKVGEDGKPAPVEHILQLQEEDGPGLKTKDSGDESD